MYKNLLLFKKRKHYFKIILYYLLIFLIPKALSSQVTVAGSAGSANGNYTTLKLAFDALNLVTNQTGKYITVSITANTTETASAVLNQPSAANWTSLKISPSGGASRLITGSFASPIINLNGADRVTINGLNTGSNSLTISNTSTTGGSALQFINDATNNTVTSCTLKSLFPSNTSGVINFLTTTGTTGNDGNTINLCDIDCGAGATASPTLNARTGIYSAGTTTSTTLNNSQNTISNCTIFNFFGADAASNGIFISTGSTDWTISNNSFYQTSTRTPTAAATHTAINISNTASGNNFIVSGNSIGGDSPNATATASKWTITAALTNVFNGITLNVGTTTASSIQGNTIKNLSIQSASTANVFVGINVTAGNVNIGTIAGNVIGSTSVSATTAALSSITLLQSTANAGIGCGIFTSSTGTVNISNNSIGGIFMAAAAAPNTLGHTFYGIRLTAGTNNVYTNIIGSTSNANSIYSEGSKSTTTNANTLSGISISGGTNNIGGSGLNQGNTISNISYNATGGTGPTTAETVYGVQATSGTNSIVKNNISNLSNVSGNIGTGSSASVVGIYVQSATTNHTASQNTISNLSNTHAVAAVTIQGIFYNSSTGTNIVERNLIYNLDASNATATLHGIWINGGTSTYRNNMIRLGTNGNSATLGMAINGISETVAGIDNLYFNSIYIGGAPTTAANNSFAFQSTITTNTRNYRNNIFWNARSNNGSTGKHYAIRVGGTTINPAGLTSNNNDLFANGTGGFVGLFNAIDRTFSAWQLATGQDANSINADPLFVGVTATNPDLHITAGTPINAIGFPVSTITTDFDGDYRANLTPTDIGADAYDAVCTTANGGTAIGSSSFCSSGTPSITASGFSTGAGTTYEWMSSSNASDYSIAGTAVFGQTDPSTLTVGAISTTTYYWLKVSCATNASVAYSNMITSTVFNLAAGNNISTCDGAGAVNITNGAVNNNYAVATWTSNGTGTFTDATSVTAATYNPSATDLSLGNVTLTLTGTATSPCPLATSTKTLTINQAAPVTTNASLCTGGTSIALTATSLCKQSIAAFGGTITSTSPTAHRPVSGANSTTCGFQQTPGDIRPYNMLNFKVSVSGNYIFTMDDNANYDAIAYIVKDTLGTSFVPGLCSTQPGGGGKFIREDDDDSPLGDEPRLGFGGSGSVGAGTMYLIAGDNYYLITTFFNNPTLPQSFSWTITGPAGGGQVVNQSPADAVINWYDAPVNGNLVATGGSFDPVPNILSNTNTVGTTTYYAACSNNLTCRTAAVYDIVNTIVPSANIGTVSVNAVQADGSSIVYSKNCDLVGKIIDATGGNTLGSTTMSATLASTNPIGSQYGFTYCKRTFEVSPTSNGSANLTFYLTQADFTDFNANKPTWMSPLPISPTDPFIANIRVTKVSTNGAHKNVLLSNSNFSWNTNGYWQLSVNVVDTSAGTYYITSTPDCVNKEVSGLTVGTPTSSTVPLTWTPLPSTEYGWFQVQYKLSSSSTWLNSSIASVGASSSIVTGLVANTAYDFRVARVCSPTYSGNWTAPVSTSTATIPCSYPPSNIVVSNATLTSITINWSPVANIGWYGVQYKKTSSTTWSSFTTGNTSVVINGLSANTSYDVQVKTFCNTANAGLSSAYSATIIANTNGIPCSLAPTGLAVATVGMTSATATWTAVTGAGWYGIRYRAVTAGNTNNWLNITSATPFISINGLLANTLYEIQVKTFCTSANAGVSSDWSSSEQFTTTLTSTNPCTVAPTGLAISAITGTTATATWNAITSGYGWYGFKHRAQNTTTPNAWIVTTTTTNTKTLVGLVSGTTYEASVKVFCNNNFPGLSSDWSDTTFTFTAGTQSKSIGTTMSNEVSIYPNPTSDELNIDLVLDNEDVTIIKVLDISGRLVKQIKTSTSIGQNNIKISLAELTNGLYIFQIINKDKMIHISRVSKK